MSVTVLKETFHAWMNNMPGPGPRPTLIVVGEVVAPTGGWRVPLRPAVPAGINPAILILDLIAVAPTGQAIDVITMMPVRYEQAPSQGYTDVTIRYEGQEFTIPV